jgi:hypothetical protein
MLALDKVTPAEFQAALDQDFELITGTGGITLRLVAVETKPAHHTRAEPFVLRFRGAPELRLPQGIYPMQNLTLGAMELFIVQVVADQTGSYFEVIFN